MQSWITWRSTSTKVAISSSRFAYFYWSFIATIVKPLALAICDQEVNKRILAVPHKVREEVSDKEMWNHSEPRNVRVSLPRRADESSEVRSSGNNVPPSASLDAETDEGRTIRWNNCAESP